MSEYVFFYLMKLQPGDIGALVPDHVAYWQAAERRFQRGGPFADHSGGMILFEAESDAAAERIAAGDPFARGEVLTERWCKAWRPQSI